MMKRDATVHLLVCGNRYRRDDGAALWATGMLLPSMRYAGRWSVEVVHVGQLDVQHLLDLPAGEPVIILDAAVGVPAGEIVTRPLDDLIDFPHGPAPHSSHALPINQVLGMANVLNDEPLRGFFVGIGAADFGYGDALSPKVREQLPAYVREIAEAIRRVLAMATVAGA